MGGVRGVDCKPSVAFLFTRLAFGLGGITGRDAVAGITREDVRLPEDFSAHDAGVGRSGSCIHFKTSWWKAISRWPRSRPWEFDSWFLVLDW
jgi:hypothetical protein